MNELKSILELSPAPAFLTPPPPIPEAEIAEMAFKATQGKKITLGNLKKLDYDDVVAIYRMANKA